MSWVEEIIEHLIKQMPKPPVRILEGTVTGLSPLEVRPDGSNVSIKGAGWNSDIVKKVKEGDRVLMEQDCIINRYYVLVRLT
ncbi:hypothetical protein ADM98_11425 [Exiguobacterium sp. BMC-KP]|uniref:hypothetical protein n=1 Tax=Exiguobacterium sp. BMC-KP TaxID=1684312 RepID=UPI0006AA3737|nr:hypothetical protein [Exiguobacterium sp. BMC-KP]KOP29478.1 hypothetical protein ADM98_11425 [Exiguobacterium sp. BMC-KP]